MLQSPREYCFLPIIINNHNLAISSLVAHLGNVVENSTLSTLTANVCPARNSPTSRSADTHSIILQNRLLMIDYSLPVTGNVVVYVPPLASRICSPNSNVNLLQPTDKFYNKIRTCSLVSVYSFFTLGALDDDAAAAAATLLAVAWSDCDSVGGCPSLNAFSLAAFSARVRLSASICSRTRCFAFASSSLSVTQIPAG